MRVQGIDRQEELSPSAIFNVGKDIEITYISTLTAMAVRGRIYNVLLHLCLLCVIEGKISKEKKVSILVA